MVFTVDELCVYLRVNKITLYRMLKSNKIPAFKIGGLWRFDSEAIDKWRLEQEQKVYYRHDEEKKY